MGKAAQATEAARQSKIASMESRIAGLLQENQALRYRDEVRSLQLARLAALAGVTDEMAAIERHAARVVQADVNNPASPIPDPPEAAPTETTEQTLQPETNDDARTPGETPGSTGRVPAEQVDTPLQPGESMPTSPATQLVDVTAPVAGTPTHVPNEQTRIETDVRTGEPGTWETAFPLNPAFGQDPQAQQSGNSGGTGQMTEVPGSSRTSGRTMASLRLAKLRIAAGLARGDEFAVAGQIEGDRSLSDAVINHEINTLSSVTKAASRQARPANLVPKSASNGQRQAPSMNTVAAVPASVGAGELDEASELFL